MDVVTSFPAYFISFAHGLAVMPTIVYVGVIALFFGLVTKDFAGVIFTPVVAGLIFLAVQLVEPVVVKHAPLAFPALDLAFAKLAVAVYVVFLVLDLVVFLVKKVILKITGG